MSKPSGRDELTPLPERLLARIAAKLVAEGRMPEPGKLADALAAGRSRVVSGAKARLSRDGTPLAPFHRVYLSSSTREGSTAEQARAGLRSPEFHNLIMESHRLPGTAGGKSGIGYWDDGAEEARIVHVSDPRKLDEIAARLGKAFRQKAVIHFRSDSGGSDIAHVVSVPSTNTDAIADALAGHGIVYKTIVPHDTDGHSEVHILDMGGDLTPNVKAFAEQVQGTHDQHLGKGTFIGADTREEAERLYDEKIGQSGISR